jgi:hypothetical protein
MTHKTAKKFAVPLKFVSASALLCSPSPAEHAREARFKLDNNVGYKIVQLRNNTFSNDEPRGSSLARTYDGPHKFPARAQQLRLEWFNRWV